MPKPLAYVSILRDYRRGNLDLAWAATMLLDHVDENNVREALTKSPPELVAEIRRLVDLAPRTEEDWAGVLMIVGGTMTCDDEYDHEADQDRMRNEYRRQVELVRTYLGREPSPDQTRS